MTAAVAGSAAVERAFQGRTVPEVRRRVSIVSEDLSGTPDEGVKNFTLALAAALEPSNDVTLVSTQGRASALSARLAPAPRTFLSLSLLRELRRQSPELIVY